MQLPFNLNAIDQHEILPANTEITPYHLRKISQMEKNIRWRTIKKSPLSEDLTQTIEDARYASIFLPTEHNKYCLRAFGNVSLPEKIIEELNYLKTSNYYTYRHILITALLSTKISMDRQLPERFDPHQMAALAIIHDLGKAKIPVKILNKKTPLTESEFTLMKNHPLIGYLMVRFYCGKHYRTYASACFEHHERLDGSGYPLHKKQMSKYSQVIAVVDVLDALISKRPYRKQPYTLRAALDLLLEDANRGKINKNVVLLLICYARATKPSLKEIIISQVKRDQEPRQNNYGKIIPDKKIDDRAFRIRNDSMGLTA